MIEKFSAFSAWLQAKTGAIPYISLLPSFRRISSSTSFSAPPSSFFYSLFSFWLWLEGG